VLLAQIALFGDQAAEWLLAPIVVAGVLMLPLLVGRSWLGMGDIKVVLLLGVALGWGVVGAIFLACLAAAPYTLSLVVRQGRGALKRRVAFAPFLALGGLAVLFAPHLASLATG
jgi:prepilin signal peptidase PulO-like enzyme (type II secretory pathway)